MLVSALSFVFACWLEDRLRLAHVLKNRVATGLSAFRKPCEILISPAALAQSPLELHTYCRAHADLISVQSLSQAGAAVPRSVWYSRRARSAALGNATGFFIRASAGAIGVP
jgi:hypothetical protein